MGKNKRLIIALTAMWRLWAFNDTAAGQGTMFTYQGQLADSCEAANGSYDLQFAIYDAGTNGNQIGPAQTNTAVTVSNGFFSTALDFGGVFNGAGRWLQISARTNGDGPFTPLNPRQAITPAPYAVMAGAASNLLGLLPVSQLSGTLSTAQLPAAAVTNGASSLNLAGTFTGNGEGITNIFSANLTSDESVASITRSLSAPAPATDWAFYAMDNTASNFLVSGGSIRPTPDGAYEACWDKAFLQTGSSGGPFQQVSAMSLTFSIDGNEVILAISGSGHDWGIVVNGADNHVTNTAPDDGNLYYYTISFATRATRTITLNNAWPFYGVYVPVTNGFLATLGAKRQRMVLLGDSYAEQEYQPFAQCEGIASQLQLLFPQLDIWALGEGGTGFVNPGISGGTNFPGRAADIISANPNYVVVYGGINDTQYANNAEGTNAIFSNATNLIWQLKTALPSAQVMLIGPQWPRSPESGDTNVLACAAALSSACAAGGIPYFNPVSNPWITGDVTIPDSGNADNYIRPEDGTHPTIPAGAAYLANKIASAMTQTWSFGGPAPSPPSGTIALLTNGIPTPVPGIGILWNSNNALYWVTTSHTNYISGP